MSDRTCIVGRPCPEDRLCACSQIAAAGSRAATEGGRRVSDRTTILIEPYRGTRGHPDAEDHWCARRYTQHGDESRTTEVLFSAPKEQTVRDWYAAYLREQA